MNHEQENEVKFYVRDLARVEEHLGSLGAEPLQPRTHEHNLRFDTPERHLTQSFQVLRLRQDQHAYLTYKGPSDPLSEVSSRREIEIGVDDFTNAQRFLEALGFEVAITYEKYRTSYLYKTVELALDETPMGNFVEIEGETAALIQKTAKELKFNWHARIKSSYLALFHQIKEKYHLDVQNLTFEEFRGKHFSFEGLLTIGWHV